MISNLFEAVKANLISGGAYSLIIKAMIVTIVIALIAWITAGIFGAVCSYYMCYKKRAVSLIAEMLCFLFRSTPALLMLLLFYYVFMGSSHISTVIIAGLAIGFYGAGHLAEILTKAIKEVVIRNDSDLEHRLKSVYFTVALPQAMEEAIFPVKRLIIIILQWTTVVGYISVNDLTEVMMQIGQRTMYPFFAISVCILFHIVLVILIEALYNFISKASRKIKMEHDIDI